MPNASTTEETPIDEGSLPFDLTVFVSQRLSVSMDEATRLLAEWLHEQRHADHTSQST